MGDWTLTLKNLLLPIFCKQCGLRLLTEENGFYCPTCWELSPRVERPFCPICGKPHRGGVGLGTRSNFLCADCSTVKTARPYRRILGAAIYSGAIEQAVKLFKFNGRKHLDRPLGDLMRETAEAELDYADYRYLIPVPLHRVRKRARGYNQSELLAIKILPAFPNAALDQSLNRIRPTLVQSRLKTAKQRLENVRGAFAVENGYHLLGETVLLIDDVVTTGDTVTECAQVLRDAGVKTVDILAAALAILTPSD